MSVPLSLENFGKRVKKEARTALTKKDKNASKELWESISYKFIQHKQSFHLSIYMADYGKFVDKGVTGVGGHKDGLNKSVGGYRFGTGNFSGSRGEFEKRIDKWMYSRGIQPRNKETGKFVKRATVNFLIRRSIYKKGLKPSLFFTKPFDSAFKDLPADVVKKYGLRMDKFFDFVQL
jgi:ribosomal protein S18